MSVVPGFSIPVSARVFSTAGVFGSTDCSAFTSDPLLPLANGSAFVNQPELPIVGFLVSFGVDSASPDAPLAVASAGLSDLLSVVCDVVVVVVSSAAEVEGAGFPALGSADIGQKNGLMLNN